MPRKATESNSLSNANLPERVRGLLRYLGQPNEKANEDLVLAYFRNLFGDAFTRQKEARQSDGYVAGSFVLELKGRESDWLAGLFQGLAYKNQQLDFAQIVVAARHFLAIWQLDDLPEEIREAVLSARGSPNALGRTFAKKYAGRRNELLKLASWNGSDIFTPLFLAQPELILDRVRSFEKTLVGGKKVREQVTVHNFTTMLKQMVIFFDPAQPIKAVRAFYSMLYAWTEGSTVIISQKAPDQAALGGEIITNLVPGKRAAFKEFVEARYIGLGADIDYDDFFARYDSALDAVDADFRRQHGIFFTDLNLSKFVMWLAKQHVPSLGRDYLVLDPACGSGNLVTNWRSPLELRHKVVSEIEPELLFAVEQRMKGDAWHNGKFTVVPKVSQNRGLNFLDRSAQDYINELREALTEKGQAPDKPLAILCNPPYRSDDDQERATAISYPIHPTILRVIGTDASSERYCCFLAQMKLICEAARSSGLPGESLLLLFTKSAWLTNRAIFRQIRAEMLESFEDVTGILVNGKEFFDVAGSWPIAFTIWRYKGQAANLDRNRAVPFLDLTWLEAAHLTDVAWHDAAATEAACRALIDDTRGGLVKLGLLRQSMKAWTNLSMIDFKRDRRRSERGVGTAGGLPRDDHRRQNKKTYGEANGQYVGFMDDLTPCRVKRSIPGRPWFRLNSQFMDVKKNRCFSGPPTHLGYCAEDLESAKKLFLWYSITRTFVQIPYPMWVDADDLWAPAIPPNREDEVFADAFAISFAENECVETYFPANNPVRGVPELFVPNPMTPLAVDSFWSTTMRPYVHANGSRLALDVVAYVEVVYSAWRAFLKRRHEIPSGLNKTYFIDERPLTIGAGLVQIRDYALENEVASLLRPLEEMQKALKALKTDFFETITDKKRGLNYFGVNITHKIQMPESTSFEKALAQRLAIASVLVKELQGDPHLGRTKLAKLFYLSDLRCGLPLQTEYSREAAGPLDQRALYNKRIGIESLAQKYEIFQVSSQGRMIRYVPLPHLSEAESFARKQLGTHLGEVLNIATVCKNLTTDQSEIVATLYACWNDLLIQKRISSNDGIIREFLEKWHPKKARFSRLRLRNALEWMKEHDFIPSGTGRLTVHRSTASTVSEF